MTILAVIGLYILMAFINMFIMHKWSKFLNLDSYDEPKTYVTQDDYEAKSVSSIWGKVCPRIEWKK